MAKKAPLATTAEEMESLRAKVASLEAKVVEFKKAFVAHQVYVRSVLVGASGDTGGAAAAPPAEPPGLHRLIN